MIFTDQTNATAKQKNSSKKLKNSPQPDVITRPTVVVQYKNTSVSILDRQKSKQKHLQTYVPDPTSVVNSTCEDPEASRLRSALANE